MRVWLVHSGDTESVAPLMDLLQHWAALQGDDPPTIETHPVEALPAPAEAGDRPEIVVVRAGPGADRTRLEELLGRDAALLVIVGRDPVDPYLELADTLPVLVAPEQLNLEGFSAWMAAARAARRRQRHWNDHAAQLQRRLDDRIVIERAKGVLVKQLGITEDEAYKRMRLLSRRQRRQMRDIALAFMQAPGPHKLGELAALASDPTPPPTKRPNGNGAAASPAAPEGGPA